MSLLWMLVVTLVILQVSILTRQGEERRLSCSVFLPAIR